MSYLESDFVGEERLEIGSIPSILFRPKEAQGLLPTLVHYHGWSSNKEKQRMIAYLLSTLGYQVILPDAINHGERNRLDKYNGENAIRYFWPTVFQSLEESKGLIDRLIDDYGADPARLGIMGHSMGGITGAGIFVHDPRIKTLVVLNGSGAWTNFNDGLKKGLPSLEGLEAIDEMEEKIEELDPFNNLNKVKNRPMLLLHGVDDMVVPIKTQEYFYEKIRKTYDDKRKIKMMKYLNLNHLITKDMLEDTISWLDKHL